VTVELHYDRDCPNVSETRSNLSRALRSANLPEKWRAWDQSSANVPAYASRFGSPTVLVDGRDVAGMAASADASCCRLYGSSADGTSGVPSVILIEAALTRKAPQDKFRGANRSLLTIPSILFSLLPFGGCPACWPIYGGVLSALGLGFLLSSRYLFPITAVLLLVALLTLGYRARTRRGYGPLILGLVASALILSGRLLFESSMLAYCGAALVIVSSLWNSWPRRTAAARCPKCTPSEIDLIQLSAQEKSL
jgi:mercuric ion transport protein